MHCADLSKSLAMIGKIKPVHAIESRLEALKTGMLIP